MALKIVDIYKDESAYGPITEPVTLTEAKAWILVDYPDDDTLITSLITYSRKAIEDFCNISIIPRTIFLTAMIDWWYNSSRYLGVSRWDRAFYGLTSEGEWSELPYGPIAFVQSVVNTSFGNTVILANNTDYFLRGQAFKQIKINQECETVLIQYLTPYYCPPALKEAILAEISFAYKNRGEGVNRYAQQNVGISERAESLARSYRRLWM
jgi:Phage gp6-like head-tail connector protein